MPKIARKISVYGDSVSTQQPSHWGRAQYIGNSPGFYAGYNDYAFGGQTTRDTLQGVKTTGGFLFGGLTFEQHIKTVDDSDIVLIALGGNDAPFWGGTYAPMPSTAFPENYLGAEFQAIAESLLIMVQHAKAAGKRVAIVGMPYMNIERAIQPDGVIPEYPPAGGHNPNALLMARGFATKIVGNNVTNRLVAAMAGVPYIATFGSPATAGQPATGFGSTIDGLHPTSTYSNDVNFYIAAQLKIIFGL